MGHRSLGILLLAAACSGKSATPPSRTASRMPTTASVPATGETSGSATPVATPAPAGSGGAGSAPGLPVLTTTLAQVGLEADSLDRSVDPCVDFYQFACGGWLRSQPIPADHARWERFSELEDKTKVALRSLLDDAAKTPGRLGDYYAACLDEAAVDKAGTTAIRPLLAKTQAAKAAKSWLAAVGELHKHGVTVVWAASAEPDLKDSTTNVATLESAGLGLPDRDYYVKPELAESLETYAQHVQRMLALAGVANAAAGAADVVAIETALAALTKTATEKRDVPAAYNPTDLKGLGKRTKSVDWKAYFKLLGVVPTARIIVGTPKYFAALDDLRKQFKPAQWASYFTYHLVIASAFSLPKPFDDEAFELQKALTGVTAKAPRHHRCIDATQLAVGELLGKSYVDKHFPPTARQAASTLVEAIVKVMGDELAALPWMSEPTRKTAQGKLAKVVRMIGYPDKWRSYDFVVKRDDFAGNRLRAMAAETKRVLGKSGKPVDRAEWLMNTFEVNAYYNPSANNTALLAGILQPPFFGPDRAIAVNMGGIGMVIGHELTHGFDDQGAQFDAGGNLVNWWAQDDKTKFEARGKCVMDQYGAFETLPKQFVNGALTLGENIADLGGVKMAFKAYRMLRKEATTTYVADGFSEDQQYFLGVAQAWCSKDRAAEAQRRLTIDPHAPPKFRIYGALRNLPEFATAFSCAAGTPMRPAQTCSVW